MVINFPENEIFIIADVDKKNVFLGEQITLTYKLYKHIDTKISGVDQFQMPDFNGFWVEELFTPQGYNIKIKKYYIKVENIRLLTLDKGHYFLLHQINILYHQSR